MSSKSLAQVCNGHCVCDIQRAGFSYSALRPLALFGAGPINGCLALYH